VGSLGQKMAQLSRLQGQEALESTHRAIAEILQAEIDNLPYALRDALREYLFSEAKHVLFSPREKRRVVTVLTLIVEAIEQERMKGHALRDDDFFDRATDDRTTAQELGEAIIYAARDEHEERKLPFLANLYAYFAFQSQIDRGMANYLVKLASALTYRQYCLLEIARTPNGRDLVPLGFSINHSGKILPRYSLFSPSASSFIALDLSHLSTSLVWLRKSRIWPCTKSRLIFQSVPRFT
jgi:hypothetical protein